MSPLISALGLLGPMAALSAGALAVLAVGMGATAARHVPCGLVKALAAAAVLLALALSCVAPEAVRAPLFRLDLLGGSMQMVFLAAALPLIYIMDPGDEVPPALVLGSLIGMALIAAAGNLLALFIGLELMSVPAYLLVARSRCPQALEAAVKYFFAGSAAGALFLMGMALHFSAARSLDLAPAPGVMGEAGLALMIAAALFKLGAVPLHFWLPDVYEASDPELAGFFSTGLKAAAALLLARLAGLSQGPVLAVLPWAAALTILFGAAVALRQQRLQRLLAYSSISHAGYMMLAVAAWARQGQSASAAGALFFYLGAYLFMSGGTFLWLKVSDLSSREQLKGLGRRRPAQAMVLSVLLLALAGTPPTAGFAAKFLVFWEAFKAGLYAPLLLAGLGALVSLGYYLGMVRDMYFDEPVVELAAAPEALAPRALVTALAVCAVLLGLMPWLVDGLWAGAR
ncbi:MAG: proton-conducting transporter membrane subunit [Elusimicrobia bacterium]|nr:proton-conducting transporter membrane subunit [Elusimicrobiota bacterium]